jgi:N-acetylmuramoyl-L-alanine amidase
MASNPLLNRLAMVYKGEDIRYPKLRAVTLAQWMLESGRGSSRLAREFYNFGGIKWRKEMAPYATRAKYEASDGVDYYCKFATIESFLNGYWAFLNRAPYSGWESHVSSAEDFINFIGPIYTPSKNYANRVLKLLPEAEALLASAGQPAAALLAAAAAAPAAAGNLGTIVIDPGHGGSSDVSGSAANHAISVSGVKEKKLTLDFSLILRDELVKQATRRNETVKVVLTRETDVNLTGRARAQLAFTTKAKLFLCIHFNGDNHPTTRGSETFFRAKENGNINLREDMEYAQAVQDALFGSLKALDSGAKDRGIKPDNQGNPSLPGFGVLNDKTLGNDRRPDPCRAAYIEAEFITNPGVEKLLISGPDAIANRTAAMAAVAKACLDQMRAMP